MARSSTASALIIVACLLLAVGVRPGWGLSCGQVASAIGPCFKYITGTGPLIPGCCSGVRNLNSLARTTPDRQAACVCLKTLSGSIRNLKSGLAAGLPGKCGVNVGYPISPSTDCSKVR